ncbi:MAG: zinc-ribbon domain-containing protein [Candidatus Sifarchaeia archaeon]
MGRKHHRMHYNSIPYVLFIIGIAFIAASLINFIRPGFPGSPWMLIPGGILLLIAIGSTVQRSRAKNAVLSALISYTRIKIGQLASELNMTEDDVRDVIVDLRTEGKIKATFDNTTGEVIIGTETVQTPQTVIETEDSAQKFCPYCGEKIPSGSVFCPNCGSSL